MPSTSGSSLKLKKSQLKLLLYLIEHEITLAHLQVWNVFLFFFSTSLITEALLLYFNLPSFKTAIYFILSPEME